MIRASLGKTVLLASIMSISAGLATAASATTYIATLSGANERPAPNSSTATGFGTLVLSRDGTKFSVKIDFSGLTGNAAAGHVHCCNTTAGNGPVAIGFVAPAATSGSIVGSFDLTKASTYSSGFFNTLGGGTVAGSRSAFLNGLNGGLQYFNVHTARFPGGEIRGQLVLSVVPEPANWALLIAGFGLTGAVMRRRRENTLIA